jgi:alpha-tubulin suppressor-like RCC1 family protein
LGFDVDWDQETLTATLTRNDDIVWIYIGGDFFRTNWQEFPLDVPAQIIDGRTMLPIRAVLESVGYNVAWDGAANAVIITSGAAPVVDMSRVMISSGGDHAMAILGDGSLWGWGRRDLVGYGTTENRYSPVRIMEDVIYVSAGRYHTAAITSDGRLWTWGGNAWGRLGDGTEESRHSPVHVMDDVVFAEAGTVRTLAVTADGNLWSLGTERQLLLEDVVRVSSNQEFTMAIRSDGSLWVQDVGIPFFMADVNFDAEFVHVLDDIAAVCTTRWSAAAVGRDGSFWFGWTTDFADFLASEADGPVRTGFTHWYWQEGFVIDVSVGQWHTMALMEDGSLWGGGDNNWGQLGDGTNEDQSGLIKLMDGVAAVSAGPSHTLAILDDGSIWGWGASGIVLGDTERTANHLSPVLIMENPLQANGSNIVAELPPALVRFSQLDPRWADVMFGGFTVAEGGCGPAAIAMVASTLHGREVLPCYVAAWGGRFYVQGVGAAHTLFTSEATQSHFGLDYRAISIHDDDAILEALRGGAMIITSVQSGRSPNARAGNQGIFNPVGLGGHIAVIYGVTAEGNVLVASPRIDLSENTDGWPLDVVRREMHSGIGIFWTYAAREGGGYFGHCHITTPG